MEGIQSPSYTIYYDPQTKNVFENVDDIQAIPNSAIKVTLIGEIHSEDQFSTYIHKQLHSLNPDLICVESCPERYSLHKNQSTKSSIGATVASQYISNNSNSKLCLIDQLQSELLSSLHSLSIPTTSKSMTDAIHSKNPLKINFDTIRDHHTILKEKDRIQWQTYTRNRSHHMASLIHLASKNLNCEQIAVITGLLHTTDIYDIFLQNNVSEETIELTNERLITTPKTE